MGFQSFQVTSSSVQHMFFDRNEKKYRTFLMKKKMQYLGLSVCCSSHAFNLGFNQMNLS